MLRINSFGKAKLAFVAGVCTDAFIRNAEAAAIPDSANPCTWNSDWDMRKPNKNKVVHQIVMVRHGQYDRDGKTDAENILTSVGREQAEATGKRLDILLRSGQIQPLKNVYYSTMARATETCKLILPQISDGPVLPDLPSTSTINTNGCPASGGSESSTYKTTVQACSMIREGAVCVPIPSCTGWNPSEEDFEKEGTRVRRTSRKSIIHQKNAYFDSSLYKVDVGSSDILIMIVINYNSPRLILSYLILIIKSILSYLNLFYLFIPYVILSYFILSYLILSAVTFFSICLLLTSSCPILHCRT